jgi:L-asparaginase
VASPVHTANPRVVVFGLGGTIAMTTTDSGGVAPTLTAEQLTAAVPGLTDTGINLQALTFRTRPGASLTFADLTDLAAAIAEQLDNGADGIVITQGTDTIEETSYLLDLLHHRPQPIVVTGAMRNPTMAGADGPANLLAAVLTAASPQARDLGCLVVIADEIHAAARVRKTHSTSVATFVSPNGGPLGYVIEGVARIVNQPISRFTVAPPTDATARVSLIFATLGEDPALLESAAPHLDGLVVAGFGVGHVPDTWVPALDKAAENIPVVLTSRTGAGPVLTSTYGFPGSERDLIGRSLIPAGLLDPYKARLLLHLCLATGANRQQIAAAFTAAGGTDPTAWPWPPFTTAPTTAGAA